MSIDATTAFASVLDARFAAYVVPSVASRESSGTACGPPHGASALADVLPRTTSTTLRTAGGVAIGGAPAATTLGPPRSTRVPAPARRTASSSDARAPSPSRPVTGTDHGAHSAASPSTCAVPSTIGERRSRMRSASTSASPPPAVASDTSSVAFAGIQPEQCTNPGARSDTLRIDRPPTVASMAASPWVGAAYGSSGSPVPTWTQSISASASSVVRAPPTKCKPSSWPPGASVSGIDARAITVRVSPLPSDQAPTGRPSIVTATAWASSPRTRAST